MKDEALKLALEALGQLWLFGDEAAVIANPAITAIKQALAAPVKDNSNYRLDPPGLDALYTTPHAAQRQCEGCDKIAKP
jgi:hypothetical protein